MGNSSLTHATISTVPTQHTYRSGIADFKLESDNPPLAAPHDYQVPVFEVILFWFICHSAKLPVISSTLR
jgi:hypothetical protein